MKYSFGPYEVRKVLSTRRPIIKFLSTKSVYCVCPFNTLSKNVI